MRLRFLLTTVLALVVAVLATVVAASGANAQDGGAQDDGAQDNGAQDNGAQDNGALDDVIEISGSFFAGDTPLNNVGVLIDGRNEGQTDANGIIEFVVGAEQTTVDIALNRDRVIEGRTVDPNFNAHLSDVAIIGQTVDVVLPEIEHVEVRVNDPSRPAYLADIEGEFALQVSGKLVGPGLDRGNWVALAVTEDGVTSVPVFQGAEVIIRGFGVVDFSITGQGEWAGENPYYLDVHHVQQLFYPDSDGDGFGDGTEDGQVIQPPGFVANGRDCDDTNAAINPFAEEITGNQVDEDCDGEALDPFPVVPTQDPGHSIATNNAGQQVVAAITGDGSLRVRTYDATSGWGSWDIVGEEHASADVAIDETGTVHLVAVTQAGHLTTQTRPVAGAWTNLTHHGSPNWDATTSPTIATNGSSTVIAAVKADGRAYTRTLSNDGWGTWLRHGAGGWSHVDIAMAQDGTTWLIGTKANGRLFTRSAAGQWSAWTGHGAPTWSADTPPAIAATFSGATIVGVKADGRLYTRALTAAGANRWTKHGSADWLSADVSMNETGRVAIAGTKGDGRLFTRSFDQGWQRWQRHGQPTWSPTADPSISVSADHVAFVGVKDDGRLFTRVATADLWDRYVSHGATWAS